MLYFTRENYLPEARKHEAAFRAILEAFDIMHEGVSLDEIYSQYSGGVGFDKWEIRNFCEKEEGVYLFSHLKLGFLSGFGSADLWKIEAGKATKIKRLEYMVS